MNNPNTLNNNNNNYNDNNNDNIDISKNDTHLILTTCTRVIHLCQCDSNKKVFDNN